MMQQPLNLLDIHLPEPVSWWPPAPGWWLLLIVIILLPGGFRLMQNQRRKKQLKKTTLVRLDAIFSQYEQDSDATKLLQSLSVLMRRSCISYHPRIDSAGLTGQAWLQYLDSTTAHKGFEHGVGEILATAPYRPAHIASVTDTQQLRELCAHWLAAQALPKRTSTSRPS